MSAPLLEVDGLSVSFPGERGRVRVVDRVGLRLEAGETLALVGESGSGKSMTALAIMRLIPRPGAIDEGSRVHFEGRNLLSLPVPQMRAVRGGKIGMIFQEPQTSLNPVTTVGAQLVEGIRLHAGASAALAKKSVLDLLSLIHI